MKAQVQAGFALVLAVSGMRADSLVLLASDASGFSSQVQAGLLATGKFDSVVVINTHLTTPTAMDLEMAGYTDVLAWTNEFPQNGSALGDALAEFHDHGGRVTIATYGLTNPGGINGGIATGDYSGLVVGTLTADPSGTLVPIAPSDPIFNGIAAGSLSYYHDGGFANALPAPGATLIATDGMGHNMIARSANGVVNINLYPGFGGTPSDAFWMLLANTFAPLDPPLQPPVANPGGPYSFCPQSKPWLLNGTQSTDPEQGLSEPGKPADQIIQYAWDLNGAGTFSGASGAQPDVTSSFSALGPGIYPMQLRVTSSTATSFPSSGLSNLTSTASSQVTVKNSCTCITTLTAAGTPNGQVQLQWPLTGSNHYNVYRSTVSGGPYAPLATTTTAGYLDTNVTSGTTYYYIVREANLLNEETCQSNQVSAMPIADTIPPVTSISEAPSTTVEWKNTSVALTLTSVDNPGGTGVKQISVNWNGAQTGSMVFPGNTGTLQLTVEGVTTVTYFGVDVAGNVESSHTLTLMIDKTAPAVSASMSPAPNTNGWSDGPVTVTFTGTDTLSGIQTCTPAVTVKTEGARQAVSGTCTDNAGNASAPVTKMVNIDWIAPAISGAPAPGKCVLWAPNNKLVTVATLTATHAATFQVTASSNEADDKDADIVISGKGLEPRVVQLRAERQGDGHGRVYTVKAVAANQAGTQTSETFTCTVPHDQDK